LDWIAKVLGDPSGGRDEIERPVLRLVVRTPGGSAGDAGQTAASPARPRRSATLLQLRPKTDR
jgi:hypothetical protein